jgi:hypothetical protein
MYSRWYAFLSNFGAGALGAADDGVAGIVGAELLVELELSSMTSPGTTRDVCNTHPAIL